MRFQEEGLIELDWIGKGGGIHDHCYSISISKLAVFATPEVWSRVGV